jgi:hypothetical protein
MASIPGALLIGLSSPYARKGVLWERYQAYFEHDVFYKPAEMSKSELYLEVLAMINSKHTELLHGCRAGSRRQYASARLRGRSVGERVAHPAWIRGDYGGIARTARRPGSGAHVERHCRGRSGAA